MLPANQKMNDPRHQLMSGKNSQSTFLNAVKNSLERARVYLEYER